jgi:hypothetical protein
MQLTKTPLQKILSLVPFSLLLQEHSAFLDPGLPIFFTKYATRARLSYPTDILEDDIISELPGQKTVP